MSTTSNSYLSTPGFETSSIRGIVLPDPTRTMVLTTEEVSLDYKEGAVKVNEDGNFYMLKNGNWIMIESMWFSDEMSDRSLQDYKEEKIKISKTIEGDSPRNPFEI